MPNAISISFELHPGQLEVFNDPTRYRVVAAGRRWGKTTTATAEVVRAAVDPKNTKKLPVFVICPTHAQAKFLYWQPLKDKLGDLVVNQNANEGLLYLANGIVIGVKGADNPDSLRGPGLFFVVLDEFDDMKPFVWSEIVRPMLTDVRGRAMFIGTPKPERGPFYGIYQRGLDEEQPDYKSWHFVSANNPFLDRQEIEDARRDLTPAEFAREYEASFDAEDTSEFDREWFVYESVLPEGFGKFITVDLCGFPDLKTVRTAREAALDEHVITLAYCNPDKWHIKDVQFGRWGVEECAEKIALAVHSQEPDAWGMEGGALKNAVMPYIKKVAADNKWHVPDPIPLSHQNKVKKQRIIWATQGRIKTGKITFAPAKWNKKVENQFIFLQSKTVHDDAPDAIAYLEQLTDGRLIDFKSFEMEDTYWEPQDKQVGY